MSHEARSWAYRNSPYKAAVRFVHVTVGDIANADNNFEIWVTPARVAELTGLNRGTVRRALIQLVDDGYLEVLDDGSGANRKSTFRFLFPETNEPEVAQQPRLPLPESRATHATQLAPETRPVAPETRPMLTEVNRTSLTEMNQQTNDEQFDTFWAEYPRKVGKKTARKAFDKAIKRTDLDTLIAALVAQRDAMHRAEGHFQYFPHASTWLNQDRWEDQELPGTHKPRNPAQQHNDRISTNRTTRGRIEL